MKKERIELLVSVDIWYHEGTVGSRKYAIEAAKDVVTSCECSFAEPKKAKLYKRPKEPKS